MNKGENTVSRLVFFSPELYFDCFQNPFNFKQLEGKKVNSGRATCDYFTTFQHGMMLTAVENCLFPFMVLHRVLNHDEMQVVFL